MAGPGVNYGAYIPSTQVWDTSEIYQTEVTSPEFKELLVRLYQNLNNMALAVNTRDAGIYNTQEFVNGQVFFPNPGLNSTTAQKPVQRQVYRLVINFGALPNTMNKPVAHGLTVNSTYTFTRIYGCATNPSTEFLPIPYASATAVADNIEIWVDPMYVNITTAADYSAYTTTYVILEYIKF